MKPRVVFIFILLAFFSNSCSSQSYRTKQNFTHADTLRGSITPERVWWDVIRYDVKIKPDYKTRSITGETKIVFKNLQTPYKKLVSDLSYTMQIDLQQPLIVDSISKMDSIFQGNAHRPQDGKVVL